MPLVDHTPPPRPGTGRGTLLVVAGAFLLLAGAIAIAASGMGEPDATPGGAGVAPRTAAMERSAAPAPPRRVPTANGAGDSDAARGAIDGVASAVEGVVRSTDGGPVVGAVVVLLEDPPAKPRQALEYEAVDRARATRTLSDGAGRFRLSRGEAAAPARVSATAEGYASGLVTVAAAARDEVVLELAPGRLLRGRVTAPDGTGVAAGVVSIVQAWSGSDYADSAGLALTEPDGSFALGLAKAATRCDLRVDAAAHGRDFFLAVPADAFAELRWQARVTLSGHVRGVTAEHAGSLAVRVRGELRDAPVHVFRTGLRRQLVGVGAVRADGSYEVADLQPGANYTAQLVQVSVDDTEIELSPRDDRPFTATPGQRVERDFEVSAPIVVRGHAHTAGTHRPAARLRVQVEHDGRVLWNASTETDADGTFELRLTTAAGIYRLGAGPAPQWVERRFASGETASVDLLVPEPIVLPVRVVDAGGAPVESITTELWITDPEGRRSLLGDTRQLDAEGRSRFEVYPPARSLRLRVMRFPRGPRCATAILEVAPGETLAEQTLTLPLAGDVRVRLVDAAGRPHALASVSITACYADGSRDTFSCRTDRDGRIDERGACRREPAVFEVGLDDHPPWQSLRLAPTADGRFDLGEVQA